MVSRIRNSVNPEASGRAAEGSGCAEEKTIRRVLRRSDSPEYFREDGWTRNPDEAKSLSDAVEVAEICARYGLNNVELALRLGAGGGDMFCTTIC